MGVRFLLAGIPGAVQERLIHHDGVVLGDILIINASSFLIVDLAVDDIVPDVSTPGLMGDPVILFVHPVRMEGLSFCAPLAHQGRFGQVHPDLVAPGGVAADLKVDVRIGTGGTATEGLRPI